MNTEEIKAEGCANQMLSQPDGTLQVTQCPWFVQFKEMGLSNAGALYCQDLDSAISRGFNPELGYTVEQTLHDSEYCIHRLAAGSVAEGAQRGKNPESLKSFEYHCAHLYWSYNEVTTAIFQAEGERVNELVLRDFEQDYGREMADVLQSYCNMNFNVID